MPYFKKKLTTNPTLSWDAFPPPPPEAENWKPDPDSIAKSGALKDPRFNRDPCAEKKVAALKRDIDMLGIPSGLTNMTSSSLSSSSPPVSRAETGGWSAPDTRASGPPYCDSTAPVACSPIKITRASCLPMPQPRTPTTSRVTPMNLISTIKLPAWTGPLEKLLSEEAASSSDLPTIPTRASIPPHLREKGNRADKRSQSACDFNATIVETAAKEENTCNDAVLAWKLATVDLGIDNAKRGLELQDQMLSEYKAGNQESMEWHDSDDFQIDHKRYLDVKLVTMLEDELDLSKRATRRELMAMTDDDLQRYLIKVTSAHKNWWVAEHRLLEKGKGREHVEDTS